MVAENSHNEFQIFTNSSCFLCQYQQVAFCISNTDTFLTQPVHVMLIQNKYKGNPTTVEVMQVTIFPNKKIMISGMEWR